MIKFKNFWHWLFYGPYYKFFRYSFVGGMGTIWGFLILIFCMEIMQFYLLISVTLSFFVGMIHNFILNKIWTFQIKNLDQAKNHKKNLNLFFKFFLVSLSGLLWSNFLMYVQVEMFNIWYVWANILTGVIIWAWNFIMNAYWTFK